jgi:hypothetical protein
MQLLTFANSGSIPTHPALLGFGDVEAGAIPAAPVSSMPSRVDVALGAIHGAVAMLEEFEGGSAPFWTIETNLVVMLTALDRNPGIEAAAEDLYRAAAAFAKAGREGAATPGARYLRLLREAERRLGERVQAACSRAALA